VYQRIGWILLLVTSAAILVFGALVAVYPRIAAPHDEGMVRALGVSTFGMGLFGSMIVLAAYRRKQRWAWFTLWYLPVFWILHLAAELPPGTVHFHQIVFIAVSLLGLLLPIRQFFPPRR
jgi:hypothetical protein